MHEFQTILDIIEEAKTFGYRSVSNGAQLYGHVPHVAPEAWLHQIYRSITEKTLDTLELEVGIKFPNQFRDFLLITNGLNMFLDSLSIYGKRFSFARNEDDDIWQPYNIIEPNTLERIRNMKPYHLIIGGYVDDDASLLIYDTKENCVFRRTTNKSKVLNTWPDFWTMLKSETLRLKTLFDDTGHQLSEDVPITPPPD